MSYDDDDDDITKWTYTEGHIKNIGFKVITLIFPFPSEERKEWEHSESLWSSSDAL